MPVPIAAPQHFRHCQTHSSFRTGIANHLKSMIYLFFAALRQKILDSYAAARYILPIDNAAARRTSTENRITGAGRHQQQGREQ
jgi:hypothetical protein